MSYIPKNTVIIFMNIINMLLYCRELLQHTCRSKYTFQAHCTIFIAVAISKPPPKQYTLKQVKLQMRCRLETRAKTRGRLEARAEVR